MANVTGDENDAECRESVYVDACQKSLLATGEYSQVIHTLRTHNASITALLDASKKELHVISNETFYRMDCIEKLVQAIETVHPMMIELVESLHKSIKDTRVCIAREIQAHHSSIVHPSSLQERMTLERMSKLMQVNTI